MATQPPSQPSKAPKTVLDLNKDNIRTEAGKAIVDDFLAQEPTAYTRGLQAISNYKATLGKLEEIYETSLSPTMLEKVKSSPDSPYFKVTTALERANQTLHLDELAGKAQAVLDRAASDQNAGEILDSYLSEAKQADETYRRVLTPEIFGKISLVKDSPWYKLSEAQARVSKVRDIVRMATNNANYSAQGLREKLAAAEKEKEKIEIDLRRNAPLLIGALGSEVKRVDQTIRLYETLFPKEDLGNNQNYKALKTLSATLSSAIEEQQIVGALEYVAQSALQIEAAEAEISQQASITAKLRDENHRAAVDLEQKLLQNNATDEQVAKLKKEQSELRDKLATAANERDAQRDRAAAEREDRVIAEEKYRTYRSPEQVEQQVKAAVTDTEKRMRDEIAQREAKVEEKLANAGQAAVDYLALQGAKDTLQKENERLRAELEKRAENLNK